MSLELSNHLFCVLENKRLEFKNSTSRVEDFIKNRINHTSAECAFFSDRNSIEDYVNNLLTDKDNKYKYITICDVMNPFVDMELVEHLIGFLEKNKFSICKSDGCVPGTGVIGMIALNENKLSKFEIESFEDTSTPIVRWESQSLYNNQFNLYKYKRLKMFLSIMDEIPELHKKSISEIVSSLKEDKIFKILLNFGNDIRQINYDRCPHCQGDLQPLKNSMSQPFCGFIPSDKSICFECFSCGLVTHSPVIHEDDVHTIYDEWDKEDFVTSSNNPYNDDSIRCDFKKIKEHLPKNTHTLDLGGGIGNFSKYLISKYKDWNVTHSDFDIKAHAGEGITSRALDFTKNDIGNDKYDLVTAWEVIEHIPYHRLEYSLKNIWNALRPGGFFVFSTPDFDSPLCKSFDFYALCPPFHYLVFGERWLKDYFTNSGDYEIFDIKHCSDFLDDAINWYGYGSETCPSMAMRSTSDVLRSIFQSDNDNKLKNQLAMQGLGTEIIMTLRKPN